MDKDLGEPITTNPVPAHVRSPEQWRELKATREQNKRGKRAALYEVLFKNFYAHFPTAEIAQNEMATQLLKDILPKVQAKFSYVAGGAKTSAAACHTVDEADEHGQDLVMEIMGKLHDGKFATSAKLQAYLGIMIGLAGKQALGILDEHQDTYVPLRVEKTDEEGNAYNEEITFADFARVNGNGESVDCRGT